MDKVIRRGEDAQLSGDPATYRAYAKVNLTLEVLGRRPDGFHELASLTHTISLADVLEVAPARAITCQVTGLSLEENENLVLRAARSLATAAGGSTGARLRLDKRIPEAAGLGGGSSDAAAALAALQRLWGVRLGRAHVLALAAELGSDVPFFTRGGAGLLGGRGERVEQLPAARGQWLVLLVHGHTLPNKTESLYRALRPDDSSDGARTEATAERLKNGQHLRDEDLVNAFARAARATFPGLEEVWREAAQAAGRTFHLSGAGPALFALAAGPRDARQAARSLQHIADRVYAVQTVGRGHVRVRTPYP